MPKFEDKIYLKHISEAVSTIDLYLRGYSFQNFSKDKKTVDAVVRELGIIGEAANNISKSFQKEHPEIPWSKIISMRNFIIHEYFGLDKTIVW